MEALADGVEAFRRRTARRVRAWEASAELPVDAKVTRPDSRPVATGVPGLDDVLGGGLPEFSFNLIAGPPGCGKTTLAHQMMFALATPQRPALAKGAYSNPRDRCLLTCRQVLHQRAQNFPRATTVGSHRSN